MATVTFPAPAGLDKSSEPPVVLWSDPAGGWQWLPTEWADGGKVVTARTDHFSGGFLGSIDISKWAHDRAGDFKNYITGRSGAAQPTCGDEAAARTGGVSVTSDRGDRVKWCFGVENGKRIVKITNNLRTFAQVSYPANWAVLGQSGKWSISNDAIARAIGTAVVTARGTHSRVIDGGDTLTIDVPDGASGDIHAEASLAAWAVSGIAFGAQVYAAAVKVAGSAIAKSADNAVTRLMHLLLEGNAGDEAASTVWGCTDKARDLTGTGDHVVLDVLKYVWGCVPDMMHSLMTGLGALAGEVLSPVGIVVGLVLSAMNLLVTGIREVVDEIAFLFNHNDPFYGIAIAQSAPTDQTSSVPMDLQQIAGGSYASLLGTWKEEAHEVNPQDGRGEQWKSRGTDTLSISSDKIVMNNTAVTIHGSTLTSGSGSSATSSPILFANRQNHLEVSLANQNVAINWFVGFYPKGAVHLNVPLNNGVTLDNSKNTIYVWTSNDGYGAVFTETGAA